jgi:hypothetical protein
MAVMHRRRSPGAGMDSAVRSRPVEPLSSAVATTAVVCAA